MADDVRPIQFHEIVLAIMTQSNLLKHGLDFAQVRHVFRGDVHITLDTRMEYGETRYQCMGLLDGRIVMVVYTKRKEAIRIISMRKANDREEKIYQNRPETP